MGDLVKGDIGPEAQYDVAFVGGKLQAKLKYDGAMGGGSVEMHIGVEQVIAAIKVAIPGQIDDLILDGLAGMLKMVP